MDERNLASWNAMIIGLTQFELNDKALSLFTEMYGLSLGNLSDAFTLGSVLRECADLKDLNKGRQVHHSWLCVEVGVRGSFCCCEFAGINVYEVW